MSVTTALVSLDMNQTCIIFVKFKICSLKIKGQWLKIIFKISKGSYKNQCKFTSAQNPPTDFAIKTFMLQYLTKKTLNQAFFKLYLLAPFSAQKQSFSALLYERLIFWDSSQNIKDLIFVRIQKRYWPEAVVMTSILFNYAWNNEN